MDTSLFFFINQGLQNTVFDLIMPFITKKAYIFFALVILPLFLKDQRKVLFVIALSLITLTVGDASSNILKYLFQRPRPCHEFENIRLLVGCGGSFSFPSGHAVNAFAVAATFSYFLKRVTLPVFFIAAIVAFSRIYVGVHYPSDVIAGAIWGAMIAGIIILLYKWSSKRFQEKPYSTILFLSLIVITFFRYYYIVTGPLDLSPDEAHYWEWSRRLDLSYYSKGPVIAYLIAATTLLIGDTVFAIRFLAPIFLALSSIFIYKLTKELFPEDKDINKKACIAGLLPQITPLFATYGVVMTIDSPFIFFWILSLYLFWKAVNRHWSLVTGHWFNKKTHPSSLVSNHYLTTWVLLGLTIGLGLLTKYTMAFFYICAFLFLILSRGQRVWFKKKEPYIAFVLSLLVFSPVIVWNLNHDWVSLKHTAGQAHIAEGIRVSPKYFFEFLGSQIGVISPLLFFLVIYGAVKNFSSRFTVHSSQFLFWFWIPILGFFVLKSLQGKVQANWAMPAYITAFIASMDYFLGNAFKKRIKILLSIALIIAVFVTAIAHYSEILNLPVKMDPTSRLKGWKEIGAKVEEIYKSISLSGGKQVFIFSDKYQVSSELAFYMPSKPRTYCINLGRRMNQYDIWGGFDKLLGFDAIFVRIDNENFPEELKGSFDSYEKERFVVERKGKALRKYIIFKCYDFKGVALKGFESY
jgi:undecaprenyl-diphosphatase